MKAVFNKLLEQAAGLCMRFFPAALAFILTFSCGNKKENDIHIVWENNKAIAVRFQKTLLAPLEKSSDDSVKICLLNDPRSTAILGELRSGEIVLFEPLLPFSRGAVYEIFSGHNKVGQFSIPAENTLQAPALTTCYPEQDTVPENLLKIYLAFSHPMSEGNSDKFIFLKSGEDTLRDVFLNLQPELWNEDRTVITLWFDPGRIKRHLQPNMLLGKPLQEGHKYQLMVSGQWKDAKGVPLQNDFIKHFVTGARDSIGPDPNHWKLQLPEKNSKAPLIISMGESLDHFLLTETMRVKDQEHTTVKGRFESFNQQRNCRFIPETDWQQGNYSLVIESRLEDLAGNNLDRPFDRDITQTKQTQATDEWIRSFTIGN